MMEKIKDLRERTGAGMVDCQKALKETDGDIEAAIEVLRKKGIAKAAKRGDRESQEGVIKVALDDSGREAYMIEVSTETDFVARNDKFQAMVGDILEVIKKEKPQSMEDLHVLPLGVASVKESLDTLSGTIGEKMEIRRFEILTASDAAAAYSHLGGRIGVLVALKGGNGELAYDIAMQAAAANPKYLDPSEVPLAEIEKEKEIYRELLAKENKPENIKEKIIEGKVNKYYEDVCLVNQEFIKDDKKKVKDILGAAVIEKFVRYSL